MADLLRRVRLIDPVAAIDRPSDVLIVDGTIRALTEAGASDAIADYPAGTTLHDSEAWVLGPGLIDLYSHSGEPGFEDRETLLSLRQAGAAGGFTRLTLLPDTHPAIDQPSIVDWLHAQTTAHHPATFPHPLARLHYWGALTLGATGEHMVELAALAATDIVGFADGQPLQNGMLLRRLLEYGQLVQRPIALWCCDQTLTGNGVVRDGVEAIRLGLPGSPIAAETAPLAALLEMIAEIGTPVHLMRVSTARAVEQIAAAKASGLPITASLTWLHSLLDITAVQGYHPSVRLAPPLGNPTDRLALLEGLRTGVIDAIAIDHTPLTYEEKTVAFAEAPPGAIGLELALPLLWWGLVETGELSALQLWQCLSQNPAHCLHQPFPAIAPGQPAELTLFDPQQAWTVTPAALNSRSTNTPWLGQEVRGRVVRIW